MKRTTILAAFFFGLLSLVALTTIAAHAQTPTFDCNGATGTYTFAGTSIKATCPTTTPPPVTPIVCAAPLVRDPATNTCKAPAPSNGPCDPGQLSTALGGKTFKRQCSGVVNIMPSTIGGNNPTTDLGAVLGGSTFPTYKYAGYSPTFTITSGYYVALAFTPTVSGSFQLVANTSYGDGGTISLSTFPGGLTKGAPGVVCALSQNGSNSLLVSTSSPPCKVGANTTYFINLADTNIDGDQLCYNGAPNACDHSTVSYTLYR